MNHNLHLQKLTLKHICRGMINTYVFHVERVERIPHFHPKEQQCAINSDNYYGNFINIYIFCAYKVPFHFH